MRKHACSFDNLELFFAKSEDDEGDEDEGETAKLTSAGNNLRNNFDQINEFFGIA